MSKALTTIRSLIESPQFREQVARALPKHLAPDRFIRIALTTIMRTPKLAQCDQASLFNALLQLSQYGIEPDGRRAHLIPFENRKRGCIECQLIIDYKGLVELVMRSGAVSYVHADLVCEGDEFEWDRGRVVRHRIDFRRPRGKAFAAYALAVFRDGAEKAEVMTVGEIEAIRMRSRAANAGPWVSDWAEMAKKTVFRRLTKWLPLSPEVRDAVEADDDQFDEPKPIRTESAHAIDVEALVVESEGKAEDQHQSVAEQVDSGEQQSEPPGSHAVDEQQGDAASEAVDIIGRIEKAAEGRELTFNRVLRACGLRKDAWKAAPAEKLAEVLQALSQRLPRAPDDAVRGLS